MKTGKVGLPLALLVLLSACAGAAVRGYEKANATRQDFLQVRYECIKDATFVKAHTGVISGDLYSEQQINCVMYRDCMEARGFNRVPNGPFPDEVRSVNGKTCTGKKGLLR
jgi:hypothetical protein